MTIHPQQVLLTVQSVILMFETLISIRIVLHVLVPLLVSLLIALFKISTPDKHTNTQQQVHFSNNFLVPSISALNTIFYHIPLPILALIKSCAQDMTVSHLTDTLEVTGSDHV